MPEATSKAFGRVMHHFGLVVSDLERSSEFYCRNFGLTEVGGTAHRGEAISAAGVEFNAPPAEFGPDTWMTYCRDPDGISIELLQAGGGVSLAELKS
jgi:catechol 2,3-dioxygenase-like lactoylglutathione lyase family enzyme